MEKKKKIRERYFEEVTEDNETEKIIIRKKFLRFSGTIMLLFFTLLFSFYLLCLLQTTSNNQ